MAAIGFGILIVATPLSCARTSRVTSGAGSTPRSADWLALLPDGVEKRRFILDCTGCHVFNANIAQENGAARSVDSWRVTIDRMLSYAGANSGFPVIAPARDAAATAQWLDQALRGRAPSGAPVEVDSRVTEYLMPEADDLPHDVAVDSSGNIVVTGMRSHRMYILNPGLKTFQPVEIPVARANPRAVEVAPNGDWLVVLGAPNAMARYTPSTQRWTVTPIGVYAHSVALDQRGNAWFNGHFTRDPEIIGRVDATSGAVERFPLPPHPQMALVPGGPIPYELRVAPDGSVWMSELLGNRMIRLDPATRQATAFTLPSVASGPRRFDVDAAGVLWIPEYATNRLTRFDPATGQFTHVALPIADAVPYVARADIRSGDIWLGTAAADAVLRYSPGTGKWRQFALPTRGALVRHLTIDARSGDVWVAYGASPGIPARIARIRN